MSTPRLFIDIFREVAEQRGDAPAVLEAGRPPMSYAQLARRARAIAARLADMGIGRENVVGVCARKSGDYIASLLGVWSAGAAFVPLDPDLPASRLDFMAREAGAQIVLAPAELEATFQPMGIPVVVPDGVDDATRFVPKSPERPEDLAYIIFTSGSTGQPKGVMVPHRGIVNVLMAQIEAFKLTPRSVSLFFLSASFDASISDIGTTLLSGAALCIEPPDALQPGRALADTVRRRGVTHVDIPPSLLPLMDPAEMPPLLQTIIIGGEVCPPSVVRRWAAWFRVVNVYGPTEATICTSLGACDPQTWEDPLIGLPIPDVQYSVVDESLDPAMPGEAGELCIGGAGLARGYVNQPELTARRFVNRDGRRQYRTGDRVVQRADGNYVFLGRLDRQVKINGKLVAPEEIEALLAEFPLVSRAAVVKRALPTEPVREGLVAFVVPADRAVSPSRERVTEYLSARLPRWMLPQRLELMNCLPVTSSGKVDRDALGRLELPRMRIRPARLESEVLAPEAEILIDIWQRILGVESVGMDDDFIALGGDSIAMLQAVMAAEARGLMIPPPLLAGAWTVRRIVAWLRDKPSIGLLGMETGQTLAPGAMSCAELRRDVAIRTEREGAPDSAGSALSLGSFPEKVPPVPSPAESLPHHRPPVRAPAALWPALRTVGLERAGAVRDADPTQRPMRDIATVRPVPPSAGFDGTPPVRAPAALLCDDGAMPQCIFLTGATGFLGSRLLPELLRRTNAAVCCLVRAADPVAGLRRVRDAAAECGTPLTGDELRRIAVHCGDVSQPQFAMGDSQWRRMADAVDAVYHCAAWVNAVHPYGVLRPINVMGTSEILLFARSGRMKRLHYASTLSVFVATDRNTGMAKESDTLTATRIVYGGYAQTKWAAERLLRDADPDGQFISFYRFGLIAADSQSGYCPPGDHLGLFIRSLAALGCLPDEGVNHLALDLTPVDYAAAAMAQLSVGPKIDAGTWHIANRQSLTLARLVEAMNAFGLPVARVSRTEWEQRVACRSRGKSDAWPAYLSLCRAMGRRDGGGNAFSHFRTMDLFQATDMQFEMENTMAGLAGSGIVCPPPGGELLERYLRYLFPSGVKSA
jgi:amino acid adenylation domain-containing protein/thioester reductase-like protein